MVILEIFLVSSIIAVASAGVSQYYVTPYSQGFLPLAQHSAVPFPIAHPQPFAAPILQNQFLNFPQFYHSPSAFVSHTPSPFVQQTYSIAQPSVHFGPNQDRTNSGRSLDTSPQNPVGGIEYGFGYRTQYDDGASSMVVFVMGPDSQKVEIGKSNKIAARKLASNLLGGQNTNSEKSEEISNALSNNNLGLDIDSLLEVYPVFKSLEQPKTSVLHLYSQPANVFQLPLPNLTPSSTPSTTSTSTSETSNNDDPESVAIESADSARSAPLDNEAKEAESIIQETEVQAIDVTSEKSQTTSESSSTENSSETSSTSSTSTTTEESTEGSDDAVESTTST